MFYKLLTPVRLLGHLLLFLLFSFFLSLFSSSICLGSYTCCGVAFFERCSLLLIYLLCFVVFRWLSWDAHLCCLKDATIEVCNSCFIVFSFDSDIFEEVIARYGTSVILFRGTWDLPLSGNVGQWLESVTRFEYAVMISTLFSYLF